MTISVDNARMPRKGIAVWTVAALLALNGALLAEGAGVALPGSLGTYFFGPKLVRAEVLVKDGGVLHDYRVDRGVIRAKSPGTLSLLERDGSVVSIAVAPTAAITLEGRSVAFSALRRQMVATVIRDGDNPAIEVRATLR